MLSLGLRLTVRFCFLLLLRNPVNTAVFSMAEKNSVLNRNVIDFIKINVSQMILRPAGYPRLQGAERSVEMNTELDLRAFDARIRDALERKFFKEEGASSWLSARW